jgi:type 1 glutamine amidotransferase
MRRALIVFGGYAGHAPEAGARLVAEMLEADGFQVEVTGELAALGRPDLDRFSLVVPQITSAQIADEPINTLVAAVRGGVGLGGFHGMATAFRDKINYQFMTGAQWVQHPGDAGVDYRVHVEKPYDPVMQGISDFDYRSEQYYLHVDPSLDVLATTIFSGGAHEATTGVKMPVVYKRQFGKGRVFYSSLGHVPAEFARYPQIGTILRRGLAWAARPDA